MKRHSIPLIILGGGDQKPTRLPPKGRGKRPLSGIKGAEVLIGGRPMIEVLVERLRQFDGFSPLYVAGPRGAYEGLEGVEPIDTNGGFGKNIQVGIEEVKPIHPDGPLAMMTCDVVPDLQELQAIVDGYWEHAPVDLWFPIVRAPETPEMLGASSWKPRYFVRPEGQQDPVAVLPSHLAIFEPEALRLKFLYRLLDLGYRSRNRPIRYRRAFLVRSLLSTMLFQDLIHVLNFRLPTFTWDTLVSSFSAVQKLKARIIKQEELELALRRIFTKRRFRKRFPDRRIQVPVVDAMSLARDIDTQEEALAFDGVTA